MGFLVPKRPSLTAVQQLLEASDVGRRVPRSVLRALLPSTRRPTRPL